MITVEVQRMYRFDTDRPLKAFVDIIVNDCLLIKGVRIMDGTKGIFITMPREQAKDSKWYDTVRCLTEDARDKINEAVLECYYEAEEESNLNKLVSKAIRKINREEDKDGL